MKAGRKQAVLGGVALSLTSHTLSRALNLVVTVALARTIGPEGMGVVAAALLIVEIVDTVRDLGLREALIYEQRDCPSIQTTAFAITVAVGILQALVLMAFAPVAQTIVDSPSISYLLVWLALVFPINALGSVPESMLWKSLRFARSSAIELATAAIKASVAVGFILMGAGIWSIAAGMLAGAVSRTVALWTFSGWRPRAVWPTISAARELLQYGRHIILVGMMTVCRLKADQFAIVLAMGDAALGIYFVAARIPEILIFGVNVAITKVTFPAYASLAGDLRKLTRAYKATINGSMILMAPVSVGLAAVADQVVPLLFGAEWQGSVPILTILALSGIPLTLGWSAGDVFKSTGRPDLQSVLYVFEIVVTVPLVWTLALSTQNLVWVAIGMLAGETAAASFRLGFMHRYYKVSVAATLEAAVRPIAAAAIMGASVMAFAYAAETLAASTRLFLSVLVGVTTYATVLFALDPRGIRELSRLAFRSGHP